MTTFAPLTLDLTFKRVFAKQRNMALLLFLLNTFLKKVLKKPITKASIIQTVELGETNKTKVSVFDMQCEDAEGNRFIVEMQVGEQEHFIKRTLFYICRAISNLVRKGKSRVNGKKVPYDYNLPVVYTLSFLNFDLDFGKNCDEVIQYLSISNDLHPEIRYDLIHMVYVQLMKFCKREEECRTDLEKLLFSFKNAQSLAEKPKSFKKAAFEQIYELAKISNFNMEEHMDYERKMKYLSDYANTIAFAEKKGIAEGKAKGLLQAARQMKAKGFGVAVISEITGLPEKEIERL